MAVTAISLLPMGSIYGVTFSIAWALSGKTMGWTEPLSAFGHALKAGGFVLLFLSPDETRKGIRPPRSYVMLIGALIIALIAFLIGAQWKRNPLSSDLDLTLLAPIVRRTVRLALVSKQFSFAA